MKIIIASIVFFVSSQICFSQGFNYLNSSCEWRYDASGFDGINNHNTKYTVYFDGIETFNNVNYFKEYRLKYETITYWNGSVVNDTVLYGPYFKREDNVGKFYQFDPSTNTEFLYLDNQLITNAQIGSPFPLDLSVNCTVQNIETIYLGATPLKKINGSVISANTGTVEGIGEIYPSCNLPIEGTFKLVCFTKDSVNIQFQQIDCSLFPVPERVDTNSNTILENTTLAVFVFPNPTTGVIHLTSAANLDHEHLLIITDLTGKIVFKEPINFASGKTSLNPELTDGSYILSIYADDVNLYQKRLVVKN
jgi:hypothetical protein